MVLKMSEETAAKMNDDMITQQDVIDVIRSCESECRYLINADNGHRVAHLQKCYQTYWVEYQPSGNDEYTVYNAYSHRMAILDEYTQ